MKWPNQERWAGLWKELGAVKPPAGWYERLTTAYAEPQRHYHNQQHIAECLAEFDQSRHLAGQPAAVELGLWFHDAVYDPTLGDNEEKSAALASQCLGEVEMTGTLAESVVRLVMATKNHHASANSDAALIIDVDLSILGQSEPRFFEYEDQIRREYAWVPKATFAARRVEILERFLDRKEIFSVEWFRNRYERQARQNLKASIEKLRQMVSHREE